MRRLALLPFLALSILLGAPTTASADEGQPTTRAEEHSKRGVELYAEGKLPEAVSEMLKAYEIAPAPGLLYNIARIYQKMDQRDLAEHYLKEFVTQPGADPDRVQKALKHLEELNRSLSAPRAQAPPSVDTPTAPEPSAPSATEPVSVAELAHPQGPSHTLAWTLMGGGGAVLIAGGVLGGLALSASSTLKDADASYLDKRDAQSASKSMALGADLCIGIGAATALVGLVLFLTADEESGPSAMVTPSVGPDHAGAQFTVRFP